MKRLTLLLSFFIATPTLIIFAALFLLFLSYEQKTAIVGFSFFSPQNKNIAYAALPSNMNVVGGSVDSGDGRVGKVTNFLEENNSPLTQYAGFIVNSADKYGIDYRLVPAIAMQESTLCRTIPANAAYNCWGFGIYGKKRTSFNSYEEAIDRVTRYFADKKSNGVDTLDELGSIYNPSDHNDWKANVASFMTQL